MPTADPTRLQLKKFIKAPRERVYAAWTKPELMKLWLAPGAMTVRFAETDVRVGGKYRLQMQDGANFHTAYGVYRKIVPNEKLVLTWGWEGKDVHDSLLTLEFTDRDGGTEVTLTHERFANTEQTRQHTKGWIGCLDNLAARIGQP